MGELETNSITEIVIGCAFAVSNNLGSGFLEKVYENAMVLELRKTGMAVEQQKPITVYYGDVLVGEYFADLLINDELIIELKPSRRMDASHHAQLLNYLKASKKRYGLLVNFGNARVEIKRIVNDFRSVYIGVHLW